MMSNNIIVYLVTYPNGDEEIFRNENDAIQACLDFCEKDNDFYEIYKDSISDYFPDIPTYEEWLIDGFNPIVYGDFPKIYKETLK